MAEEELKISIGEEEKEEIVKTEDPVQDLAKQYAELKAKDEENQKKEEVREAARQDAERRAREAQQRAERARQEADLARTQVSESEFGYITQGLSAAESEAEAGAGEYARAMEAGDFNAAAKAQRKMAKAEARIERLEEIKFNIERRQQEPPKQEYQPPSDPVEAYVQGRTEQTAGWLRAHRDWVIDPKKNVKLTAAHWDAVDAGLTPDTDDYFAHVETKIGLRNATEPPKPRRQAPVAPVNASSQGGMSGTEVRLTKGEAASAQDGTHVWTKYDLAAKKITDPKLVGEPIGLKEMARRKLEMTKAGWYDKDRVYSE